MRTTKRTYAILAGFLVVGAGIALADMRFFSNNYYGYSGETHAHNCPCADNEGYTGEEDCDCGIGGYGHTAAYPYGDNWGYGGYSPLADSDSKCVDAASPTSPAYTIAAASGGGNPAGMDPGEYCYAYGDLRLGSGNGSPTGYEFKGAGLWASGYGYSWVWSGSYWYQSLQYQGGRSFGLNGGANRGGYSVGAMVFHNAGTTFGAMAARYGTGFTGEITSTYYGRAYSSYHWDGYGFATDSVALDGSANTKFLGSSVGYSDSVPTYNYYSNGYQWQNVARDIHGYGDGKYARQ